jgi:sulfate adenylyltransferase subunit 2
MNAMTHLERLEATSVHILREAYREFKSLVLLWSIGKDSTVLLWLARKAFFGHVPFPLMHIDTSFKIPEMIAYRDPLPSEWHLDLIVGENRPAIAAKQNFPDGALSRVDCCRTLKSEVANVGESRFNSFRPDLNLDEGTSLDKGVQAISSLLREKKVIPDYQI